jgi:hypothetical protein
MMAGTQLGFEPLTESDALPVRVPLTLVHGGDSASCTKWIVLMLHAIRERRDADSSPLEIKRLRDAK